LSVCDVIGSHFMWTGTEWKIFTYCWFVNSRN